MGKPQRIRSRIMLLIYSDTDSSFTILEHLKKTLKIKDDNDWAYIIKTEQYISEQIDTIVFIELKLNPDVPLHKFNFVTSQNLTVVPSVHCWSDKELLLRYILTFSDISCLKNTVLTNFDNVEIEKRAVILKVSTASSNISLNNSVSSFSEEPLSVKQEFPAIKHKKPSFSEKQLKRFNKHYSQFNEIITSSSYTSKTLMELERKLGNMNNYSSYYVVPEEITSCINECREKLKEFKRKVL